MLLKRPYISITVAIIVIIQILNNFILNLEILYYLGGICFGLGFIIVIMIKPKSKKIMQLGSGLLISSFISFFLFFLTMIIKQDFDIKKMERFKDGLYYTPKTPTFRNS